MSWINKSFRAGQWVEIKSRAEILATLDSRGELDNLPFMPEMLKHCGRRYRVLASAHKTCDTVNHTGGRRLRDTVHLDTLRCDGSSHAGCQANCLTFWKTEWLHPLADEAQTGVGESDDSSSPTDDSRLHELLVANAAVSGSASAQRFRCQATRLFDASEPLSRFQFSQYLADIRSRNVSVAEATKTAILAVIYNLREIGIGYRLSVWLYERAHEWLRGFPAPKWRGKIEKGNATPDERLDLQVGETVQVRSVEEILSTLNKTGHNRGLSFDPEMVPFCGHRFRVADRVTSIVNEKTGEMMRFDNPCIVLDGVVCRGQYSKLRLLCPRRITPYWREIWLRRVE